jgi:hypothetical protein
MHSLDPLREARKAMSLATQTCSLFYFLCSLFYPNNSHTQLMNIWKTFSVFAISVLLLSIVLFVTVIGVDDIFQVTSTWKVDRVSAMST